MQQLKDLIRQRRIEIGKTLEEIGNEIGVSKATVQRWESGEIKDIRRSKLVALAKSLDTTPAYLMGWDNAAGDFDVSSLPHVKPIKKKLIPMLGSISCGEPSYAEEDFQYYVSVGAEVHADFALHAKGDSMIGARIFDGDIVFVRKQPDVEDGQVAVVLIDDETLLKRVYKLPDGRIQLRAENPKYKPIMVGGRNETRTIRILGRAVAVQTDVI